LFDNIKKQGENAKEILAYGSTAPVIQFDEGFGTLRIVFISFFLLLGLLCI